MSEELFSFVASFINWVWQLLNSSFFTALAGAFAGACSAAWIVSRIERKRRLLEEIQNTNAAITEAFWITNSFCVVKGQLIKPLKDAFDKQRSEMADFQKAREQRSIPSNQPFAYEANFQDIKPIRVSMEALRRLLFEKISIVGRPLNLAAVLSLSVDGLNSSLENRNEIIATYKANPPDSVEKSASIYFGLPDKEGHVDTSYPDTVDGIAHQTDDCIFYSKLLGDDLVEHGQKLSKAYGRKSPKIQKIDFEKADQDGLIPDSSLYLDWLNMKKSSTEDEGTTHDRS